MKVFICDNSPESIFSAIYIAYEEKCSPKETLIQIGEEENLRLFCEYKKITTDIEKSKKVVNTIRREFGEECYENICCCLSVPENEKAQAVYQTIAAGLAMKNRKQVMGNLANDDIRTVFELSRKANNEIMRLKEFLRFQELESKMLFAKIGPKCDIITFLAPHFADRFPLENFVIFDELRKLFIVHPAKKNWSLLRGEEVNEEMIKKISNEEKEYKELFTYFCHKIEIKERKNYELQRQMLPLRFRKYMVEFDEN